MNGQFKRGYDPRRRLLTQADRKRGFANAPPKVRARIRCLYRAGRIVRTGQTVYSELEI